jgi:2-polyprenyl-6-methoxyphenol hydroxylase-like FAD-dependent oxidoreductase
MSREFDVIVVGARCAGAPLATLLARQGVRVAVVERATFPRDTLSTHIVEAPAINFLRRLGVMDDVRATGASPVDRIDGRMDDAAFAGRVAHRPGDAGAFLSVRRFVLDPILASAAAQSGAEMLMATSVVGLERSGARVQGVRVGTADGEAVLRARLVVGADGRNSTIAGLAGARKYSVVPNERFGYWGFFEGADPGPDAALIYHRWDGRFIIAIPADGGLYEVIALPDNRFRDEFATDREQAFLAHARACGPVAEIIRDARRVGKLQGMKRWEGFFRESAGMGWALVGDAGQFKDPAPGQGITDAFRQAEALAPAIVRGLGGSDAQLDAAVAEWTRWRDHDAGEHYWLATDFGAGGPMPVVVREMIRRLDRRGQLDELFDLVQHRANPSAVFTPGRLLSTAAALLAQPGIDRRAVLREVGELMGEDLRRRRLMLRPEFVAPDMHGDAGETNVPEPALAA